MSMSQSSGSSTSRPVVTETPENSLIDQIAGIATQLGQQMSQWADQEFAKTSAVTDQTVGNFLQVSQKMMGFSQGLTDQYNNLFAPENKQLVQDANSYASPAHMAADMGMAGATAAQSGKAAMDNATQALQAYGIDPSSGRYAALDKAAAVQNSANIAGAENVQRNADIATGQKLRTEAVQVGAQLPAAITNTANTAIQANAGASNAELANANTGVNMKGLADKYLGTAMGIKLPLQGQNSQSSQQSTSSSPQQQHPSASSGGSGGSGAGGGPGIDAGKAWMPDHGSAQQQFGGGGGGRGQPGSAIIHPPAGWGGPGTGDYSDPTGQDYNPLGGLDPNDFSGGAYGGGEGSMGIGAPGSGDWAGNPGDISGGDFGTDNNPFNDSGFGQALPSQDWSGGDTSGYGGQDGQGSYYDPSQNQAQLPSDWNDPQVDYSGGGGSSAFDSGSGQSYSDPQDYSNYDDGSGGGDFNFAGGGAIPSPTTGGRVPPQASPSRGAITDDVPANVNVGEFIVPRDVAMWKGQEFFQKLIAQARMANQKAASMGAHGQPARPGQPNPAATQRPTFVSKPVR